MKSIKEYDYIEEDGVYKIFDVANRQSAIAVCKQMSTAEMICEALNNEDEDLFKIGE